MADGGCSFGDETKLLCSLGSCSRSIDRVDDFNVLLVQGAKYFTVGNFVEVCLSLVGISFSTRLDTVRRLLINSRERISKNRNRRNVRGLPQEQIQLRSKASH
jgi:hypothetical protein